MKANLQLYNFSDLPMETTEEQSYLWTTIRLAMVLEGLGDSTKELIHIAA